MKTLIFHVGAAKTASTSIQMALCHYSRSLNTLGFYTPQTLRGKHPELAFYSSFDLFNFYSVYASYLPKNFDSCSDILAYFHGVSRNYIESFLSSDYHTLILTDELLPYYCNTCEKLHRLSTLFPAHLRVHFIYYTRPPADMYISLYSTLVKVNQTNLWPHQFFLPTVTSLPTDWIVSPEMFDHATFIQNAKEIFGASCISVFSFPIVLKSMEYHSPVHHFFSFLGIREFDPAIERVTNPRLDYISLFVLSFINYIARRLSGFAVVKLCLVPVTRVCIIPILESFSLFSVCNFPSKCVLRSRSFFDKLFM